MHSRIKHVVIKKKSQETWNKLPKQHIVHTD